MSNIVPSQQRTGEGAIKPGQDARGRHFLGTEGGGGGGAVRRPAEPRGLQVAAMAGEKSRLCCHACYHFAAAGCRL